MLAREHETWVITRSNNRALIEGALATLPDAERLRFVYVDLPRWARFWKRGRIGVQPYYVLWQSLALRAARALQRDRPFDVVWHVTMANAWIGSTAALAGAPFVYGPIGGAMSAPLRTDLLGGKGVAYEAFRKGLVTIARLANPLARVAWRRADLILAQNPETVAWLPSSHRSKAVVFPNVALEPFGWRRERVVGGRRTMLYAGRLMPLKGLSVALHALARLPEWTFEICGTGRDEPRLRLLADRLGIGDRVVFRGKVPRADLLRMMREDVDVFVFPSLRDDAGWAVAEAITARVPVVCLKRGGPQVLVGDGVAIDGLEATADALAVAIRRAHEDGRWGDPLVLDLEARADDLRRVLSERPWFRSTGSNAETPSG
jgi:glycosyltransferase involved in cell wall biosynthesis